MVWTLALLLVGGLAAASLALYGMGPRVPLHDERSYLDAAKASDPYAPSPFLRMPLFPWLVARCKARAPVLRAVLAMLSVLTVLVTAIAGWQLGGPLVAALAGSILLVQPERVLLSCHVWPDALLALVIAVVTLLLVLRGPVSLAWLSGLAVACTLGALVRIDFLVVPPIVLLSSAASGRNPGLFGVVLLLAPVCLAVGAWTLRNRNRYGVTLPDNTWIFNLMVTQSEARRQPPADLALEPVILETLSRFSKIPIGRLGAEARRSLTAMLQSPVACLRGIANRIARLCGPDSFLCQKILPRNGALPLLHDGARRFLEVALRIAFPLLLSLAVLASTLLREPPAPYTWPALGMFAVAAIFFARTRFRMAQMPTLSLLAADGLVRLREAGRSFDATQWALAVAVGLLLWGLLRMRSSEISV